MHSDQRRTRCRSSSTSRPSARLQSLGKYPIFTLSGFTIADLSCPEQRPFGFSHEKVGRLGPLRWRERPLLDRTLGREGGQPERCWSLDREQFKHRASLSRPSSSCSKSVRIVPPARACCADIARRVQLHRNLSRLRLLALGRTSSTSSRRKLRRRRRTRPGTGQVRPGVDLLAVLWLTSRGILRDSHHVAKPLRNLRVQAWSQEDTDCECGSRSVSLGRRRS